MKKFEFGLFALCALVGGYLGSLYGIAIAICAFMTIDGVIEEIIKQNRQKNKDRKEETK